MTPRQVARDGWSRFRDGVAVWHLLLVGVIGIAGLAWSGVQKAQAVSSTPERIHVIGLRVDSLAIDVRDSMATRASVDSLRREIQGIQHDQADDHNLLRYVACRVDGKVVPECIHYLAGMDRP